MNRKWFSITARSDSGKPTAEIHLFDEIGFWGVTARDFVDELKAVDAEQIDLHINSPGGAVFEGVAIQNALKHHKANVTVYIDGIAGSIASIIALAGDQIFIADNAYVMIHNPSSMVWGEASDLLKEVEVLNRLADGIAADYARHMDITVEAARALMDAETWYLGQEAVDAGYADSTYEGAKAVASFDLNRFSAKAPKAAIDRFNNSSSVDPLEDSMSATTTPAASDADQTADDSSQVLDVVDTATTPATDTEQTASAANSPDVQAAVREALAVERQRTAEITALGSKFGFDSDAEQFITNGKSVSDFRAHVLAKSPDDWKASLAIKNPSQQASEADLESSNEGTEAVAKIKERRKARYAGA